MIGAWLGLDCFSEKAGAKVKGQAFSSCLPTLSEQEYFWRPLGEQEWLNSSVPKTFLPAPRQPPRVSAGRALGVG